MAEDALRLRVQFTKPGPARFLSHAEYARAIMMGARRSGLPLLYAGKHRPRMRLSLSPPLPIGITSECELVDLFLEMYLSPLEAGRMLNRSLPAGIEASRCRLMGRGARSVGKLIDTALYAAALPEGLAAEAEWDRVVKMFVKEESILVERVQPRRTRVVDLRPGVHRLEIAADPGGSLKLRMMVDDGTRGTIKPREVLRVVEGFAGLEAGALENAPVHREGLFTMRGDRFVSPMEVRRGAPAV